MKIKKKNALVVICLTVLCIALLPVFVMANDYEPSEFDDLEYFNETNKSVIQHHAHPEKLLNLPICRQATLYTSGVACMLSVMRYAKYDFDILESDLSEALGANEDEGVKTSEMVRYLNEARLSGEEEPVFNTEFREGMTISDLKDEIDKGNPVICDIQAWNWDVEGYSMELDYTEEWLCGHWAVAIGYSKNNIFFMDPSTSGSYTYIPNDKMMERWHDRDYGENGNHTDHLQSGIIVKLCRGEEPDGERYKDAFYGLQRHAKPRKVLRLPSFRQATSYTSGPACLLSVMRYAKYDYDIREDKMINALGASKSNGVDTSKMVRFLNAVSYNEKDDPCFNAELKANMSLDGLKAEIDNGHPVICAVQTEGHIGEWGYGHWAVAIGYDAAGIFFMDPTSSPEYTYMPNEELQDRWHAYIGADSESGTEYDQTGIVVEICGDEEPDCERYKDAFYGLM